MARDEADSDDESESRETNVTGSTYDKEDIMEVCSVTKGENHHDF